MEHICDFRKINESKDGILEACRQCHRKLATKKDRNGRIDNKKYLKEHQRDTAQPFGKTSKIFNKIYGEEAGYISKFKQ